VGAGGPSANKFAAAPGVKVGVDPGRARSSDRGMPEVQHESVFFEGRVQGVGFRYQTLQLAREFEVAGYVCNLPDGRVQLEVEGTPKEIDDFVVALQQRMIGYVRKVERNGHKREPAYKGFVIR
jgi:acylphosphatase